MEENGGWLGKSVRNEMIQIPISFQHPQKTSLKKSKTTNQ